MRSRRLQLIAALLALALALVPVFQLNILGTADPTFFTTWDNQSDAIVLAGIERAQSGAADSPWAMFVANPQVLSPFSTFDALTHGAQPTATGYAPYTSSLELQARLFQGAYRLGCTSFGCLQTLESTAFSLVLVAFAVALASVTRRSLGVIVVAASALSPWVVGGAHNLYWVMWTWLLPAIAACAVAAAGSRRTRALAVVAVGIATGLKAATGYEYLTTTTLLAASIPVVAHLLGRRRHWRAVLLDAVAIVVAAVAAFVVVLVVHALVSGDGSLALGLQHIVTDAMKRTYGDPGLGGDELTVQSLKVSPITVIGIYLVDWPRSVFSIGMTGSATPLQVGPGAFWVLLATAAGLTVLAALRGDRTWRRDGVLLAVGLAPAVSWFVFGKSHAYAATQITYVLWYFVLIPLLLWIIGARTHAELRRARGIVRPAEALDGVRGPGGADGFTRLPGASAVGRGDG